jgi:hypothetical protein
MLPRIAHAAWRNIEVNSVIQTPLYAEDKKTPSA